MATGYHSSERREMLAFLPATFTRLLDVGCSEGGFGAAVLATRPGTEVWGVEPHQPSARVAAARLTHVVNAPFCEDASIPDAYFDVITFNDSLEHMVDEHAALRLAFKKLLPRGTLVCSVPNVRYLENLRELLVEADWRYVDSGILDRTHLRFFTKKSIRRAVEDCGFSVLRIEGINSHWWSGWKIGLLKLILRERFEDTRWLQFVVVAARS
jgi:2-polyprenyl-3-methyl-5-hydroxy-6-metoxy-1,4-benzoquinol methylase